MFHIKSLPGKEGIMPLEVFNVKCVQEVFSLIDSSLRVCEQYDC